MLGAKGGGLGQPRPGSTIHQPYRNTFPHMGETQTLAVRALRQLLDDPDRTDWDELIAANRSLIKAMATGKPMMRKDVRIVAEHLREAGWTEGAIGAATTRTDIHVRGG
jgi:hypothetical protein